MSTLRTPEPFWRMTGPKAPWGLFDPHASLNFSFDLTPWVVSAGIGLTLSNCEVLADPLLLVDREILGTVVTVRARAAIGQTLAAGVYLPITLRMTLSDGQRDDRTFWLMPKER